MFDIELNSINKPCVIVIGISEKADIEDTLYPLTNDSLHDSVFNQIIFTEPLSGRNKAVPAEKLDEIICNGKLTPRLIIKNPIEAVNKASFIANKEGLEIVIIGSVYLVGDILNDMIITKNLDLSEELRVHR